MRDAFGKKMNDKHTIKYEILSVNSPIQVVGFMSDARRIDWGQSVAEKSASTETITDEEEHVVRPVTP
jgi:hypothetical protein